MTDLSVHGRANFTVEVQLLYCKTTHFCVQRNYCGMHAQLYCGPGKSQKPILDHEEETTTAPTLHKGGR